MTATGPQLEGVLAAHMYCAGEEQPGAPGKTLPSTRHCTAGSRLRYVTSWLGPAATLGRPFAGLTSREALW